MPVPQFCIGPRKPMRFGVGVCAQLIVVIEALKNRSKE